ncbi:hypothetical protein OKW21_001878 [Catalinimonas alkaloidigena]|nr:hypothetical protein [Catalinimonas alkaloidigena]
MRRVIRLVNLYLRRKYEFGFCKHTSLLFLEPAILTILTIINVVQSFSVILYHKYHFSHPYPGNEA